MSAQRKEKTPKVTYQCPQLALVVRSWPLLALYRQDDTADSERMTNCNHQEGDHHDCTYVNARNALIPSAEKLANRLVMELPSRWLGDNTLATRRDWAVWCVMFHAAMNVLWRIRSSTAPTALDPAVEVRRVAMDWLSHRS